MMRLLFKKQICMEGGCMLSSLIVMFMFIVVFSLSVGMVLGKWFWRPPC